MQNTNSAKIFSTIMVVLGIAGALISVYRLYNYSVNGDQFGMFISGVLIIIFTIFTINNYLKLRRIRRSGNKKNDSEEIV